MSNHDSDDKVSAVCSSLTGMHVAVGTMRGKVYFINRFSGELERKFEPHDKKVTGIFIRDQHSIVTSSNDGTIHVQSLKAQTPSKRINPKEYEISCFCSVDQNSDQEFVIGFGKGDMMYYKEGVNLLYQVSTTKKVLHKDSQEGSIISCVYYRKVLAWSTSKMIRLRYYPNFEDAGRNICCIDLPPTRSPKFSEYLYHQSTTIKPSIIFMKSKQ